MIRVEWCFNEQVLRPPLPSRPSQPTLPSQNDHGNFFSSGILLPIRVRTRPRLSTPIYINGRIVLYQSTIRGLERWEKRYDNQRVVGPIIANISSKTKFDVDENVQYSATRLRLSCVNSSF